MQRTYAARKTTVGPGGVQMARQQEPQPGRNTGSTTDAAQTKRERSHVSLERSADMVGEEQKADSPRPEMRNPYVLM